MGLAQAQALADDPAVDFEARFAQFDTFLVGRRTFELMTRPGSPPLPRGSKTFVVSRTLSQTSPAVSVLAEISPAAIARVRAAATKDIWLFGGSELFRNLLNQGLVDTVEVGIVPVLLGGGLPFLPPPARDVRLRLTSHRVYPSGLVSLEYAVIAPAA